MGIKSKIGVFDSFLVLSLNQTNKNSIWLCVVKMLILSYLIGLLASCGGGGSGGGGLDNKSDVDKNDETNPSISILLPEQGATITDITQSFTYELRDTGSGIDENSLVVTINNADLSRLTSYVDGVLTISPDAASYWSPGLLNVRIDVLDLQGNSISAEFSFIVEPETSALPLANPGTGFAPLTVQLTPFNTTSTAIVNYEWDFDNDGIFDVTETVGRNQSFIFKEPGGHTVTLRVTDAEGKQETGTVLVMVNNRPPIVSAEAVPSNGNAPLNVNYRVNVDDNEGVALYEWDFDGDGKIDESGERLSSLRRLYESQGVFQSILTVTDVLGVKTIYNFPDIQVLVNPEGYPAVTARTRTISGQVPLSVSFSTTQFAVRPRTISKWEWDFDGDGSYDFASDLSGAVAHEYTTAGDYYAKVRVTDSDNQRSEDVIRINVLPLIELSRSTDTIDVGKLEKVTINTTLGGSTTMSLLIENRFGGLVKTLVPVGVRVAGSYQDEWNGEDESGKIVSEDEYRVVLVYDDGGNDKRLDLSTTSGGESYSPTRTRILGTFEPFAYNPLQFDFTISQSSEVTAFMGNFTSGAGERLVTLMQRRPTGAGTHRIIWNGEDSSGKLIELPERETFIIGMFAYTLPDNGIFVRSGAHVSNLQREPSILVPDSVDNPVTKLQFELSNDANVRMAIHNAETGRLVANFNFPDLVAGSKELTWDGKNSQGIFVAPGKYRLGLTAIDRSGFQSMTQYVMQQVYY